MKGNNNGSETRTVIIILWFLSLRRETKRKRLHLLLAAVDTRTIFLSSTRTRTLYLFQVHTHARTLTVSLKLSPAFSISPSFEGSHVRVFYHVRCGQINTQPPPHPKLSTASLQDLILTFLLPRFLSLSLSLSFREISLPPSLCLSNLLLFKFFSATPIFFGSSRDCRSTSFLFGRHDR